MKKIILPILAVIVMVITLSGFQKSKAASDRHYGGSASVSVVVYELIFIPGGSKRGKELARYDLNETVNCSYDDISSAKTALLNRLESQRDSKGGPGKEAVFSGSVKYDVDSCSK